MPKKNKPNDDEAIILTLRDLINDGWTNQVLYIFIDEKWGYKKGKAYKLIVQARKKNDFNKDEFIKNKTIMCDLIEHEAFENGKYDSAIKAIDANCKLNGIYNDKNINIKMEAFKIEI